MGDLARRAGAGSWHQGDLCENSSSAAHQVTLDKQVSVQAAKVYVVMSEDAVDLHHGGAEVTCVLWIEVRGAVEPTPTQTRLAPNVSTAKLRNLV